MASTTMMITLDEALASRLTAAAEAQGVALGSVHGGLCRAASRRGTPAHGAVAAAGDRRPPDRRDRSLYRRGECRRRPRPGRPVQDLPVPARRHVTASLHKLGSGRGAGAYYTSDSRREAKPRNRDEYYARSGCGVWWSSGGTIVKHKAAVELATFQDLCAGFDPRTGAPLVRNAGPGSPCRSRLHDDAGKVRFHPVDGRAHPNSER